MWEPYASKVSNVGVSSVSLRANLLSNRKIFIDGEINSELANSLLMQFQYLQNENDEPIKIYINSPGGEVNAGLLIYDLITNSNVEVNLYCTGMAASMAAIIFASGKKGHRYILPHSKVMIHEPLISGGLGGSATTIKNTAESILKIKKITCELLAKYTGKTVEEIDKAIEHDNFMDANEAIEFGICDKIAGADITR